MPDRHAPGYACNAIPSPGAPLAGSIIRLWRRDHLPVRAIVIFLRPLPRVPQPPCVLEWMGSEVLRCGYEVVRLSGTRMRVLPAERVLETPHVGLWPLAGLMANMSTELAVATAERIAAAPASQQEQSEVVSLLALLAGNRLAPDVLLAASGRNAAIEDLLRELGVAQLCIDQGRLEGRTEGRVEGLRQAAELALEGLFGAIDPEMREAIAHAGIETLEAVITHIATYTLEQIRQRLRLD